MPGTKQANLSARKHHRAPGRLLAMAPLALAAWVGSASVASACRDTLADVVEPLLSSVVNISTSQNLKSTDGVPLPNVPEGSPFEEFFQDFFRNAPDQRQRRVSSLGSGFVIDGSGFIVTNNHVIANADEIEINFSDGSALKVIEVVGRDKTTDLALLRVEPETPLPAVSFGDSGQMRVGDCVIAIGNPFGLGGTVTTGIVSALKRDINNGPYDEFLQTDAAINKGNSGGPLFNLQREVIGVNTAIMSPTGGSIGIGFAVPATTVKHVVDQLREFGETRRGWLGVRIQAVTEEIAESLGLDRARGAMVASVDDGGPAKQAGIEAGDVILSFNNVDVESVRSLPRLVARSPIGAQVPVRVLRKGVEESRNVTVERLSEPGNEAKPKEDKVEPEAPEELTPEPSMILGMALEPMSEELRHRYRIDDTLAGIVVTSVAEESPAGTRGIAAGDVILEVTQQTVASADDVARRIDEVRRLGRPRALFLIASPAGDIRFVAIPIDEAPLPQ